MHCDFFIEYCEKRNNLIESSNLLKLDKIRSDAFHVLSQLAMRYKLILLTGRSNKKNLIMQLKSLGLLKYLNNVICVPHFYTVKDKADVLKNLESCVCYVGDTDKDILAANASDVRSIGINGGLCNSEKLLSSSPWKTINNLKELLEPKLDKELNNG